MLSGPESTPVPLLRLASVLRMLSELVFKLALARRLALVLQMHPVKHLQRELEPRTVLVLRMQLVPLRRPAKVMRLALVRLLPAVTQSLAWWDRRVVSVLQTPSVHLPAD
jgi:hypothetical protein